MPVFISIIILGIIEGITEFLPVSSTGHLLIAQYRWLPKQSDLFNVVIQGGAVLAVIPLFSDRFKKIANFSRDAVARDYFLKLLLAFVITGFGGLLLEKQGSPKLKAHSITDPSAFLARLKQPAANDGVSSYISANLSPETKQLLKEGTDWNADLQKNLILDLNRIESAPLYDSNRFAAVTLSPQSSAMLKENPDGHDLMVLNRELLHDAYPSEISKKKSFKLPEKLEPVALALLVGGILFLVVEFYLRGKTLGENVTWGIAVAVGFGQLVAIIFPGASRSGTTILISLLMGLSRPAATEFSFLVSIPTMLAASGYKIFESFHHPVAGTPPENWNMVLLGTVVSAIVSFIAVKWLLHYVQKHTFNVFGYYRIIVGVLILVLLRQH